jgi:hypothetical protein
MMAKLNVRLKLLVPAVSLVIEQIDLFAIVVLPAS